MAQTSLKKRVAQVIIGLLAILLVVIGVALAYVSTDAFLERLRALAVDTANESLNAELTIDRVEGSVWSNLNITGIHLKTAEGKPLLDVDRIDADYGVWGALGRELTVDDIRATGVVAYVVKDGDTLEWQNVVKPDDTPSDPIDFDVILSAIEIDELRVVYLDAAAHPDVERTQVEAALKDPKVDAGAAILSHGSAKAKGRIELAGTTTVQLTVFGADIRVEGMPANKVNIENANVWLAENTKAQVQSIVVPDWIAISSTDVSLAGEQIDAVTSFRVEPGINRLLATFGAPKLVQTIDADAKVTGKLTAPRITMEVRTKTGGAVKVEASIQGDAPQWSAQVTFDKIAPQLLIDPSPIDALLTGDLSLDGVSFDFKKMTANGRANLKPSRVDIYHINDLQAAFSLANQVIRLEKLSLDTPYAKGTANGGFGLESGEFDLTANLGSGSEVPDALKKVMRSNVNVTGNLSANGHLLLDAATPLGMIDRVEVKADWDLKNFAAEDVQVPVSKGDLGLSLVPEGSKKRIKVDADITARNVTSRAVRLRVLDLNIYGGGLAEWPPADPLALLKSIGATFKVHVDGLHSAQAVVARVNVDGRLTPAGGDKVTWSVRADGTDIRASGAKVDAVRADLRGAAVLDTTRTGANMVRSIDAQGVASARGVDSASAKVGDAAVEIDVHGPPKALKGTVRVDATQVAVSTYNFDQLSATVTLKENRKFTVEARATQPEKTPASFDAMISGSYRPDFSGWDIDDLQLNAGEDGWRIENGARIDTARGIYAFDNAVLRHAEQSINIDGTWRQGRDQDVKVAIKDFSIADAPRQFGVQGFPDVKGTIDGNAEISGTARDPSGFFDITIRGLIYGAYGPFDVHVAGSYARDILELTALEVDGYESRLLTAAARVPVHLETTGKYKIFWDDAFSVAAHADALQIQAFRPLIQAIATNNVAGDLTFDITLEGKLADPKLDANLDLSHFSANIPSQNEDIDVGPLGLTAKAVYRPPNGTTDGLKVELSLKDARGEAISSQGSAAFPLAKLIKDSLTGVSTEKLRASIVTSPFTFAMNMKEYDLQRFNISPLARAKAEGRLTLELEMEGTPEDPRGKITGKLAGFGWDRFRDIFVDIDADVSEQMFNLSRLRVEWDADEVLTGRAKIPVPMQVLLGKKPLEDLPLDVAFTIPDLPIAKLSAVDYTFASIRGTMRAVVSLDGSLSRPIISAKAQLTDTVFANKKTGNIKIEATGEDNRISTLVDISHAGTSVATIRAEVPLLLDVMQLVAGAEPRLPGDLKMSMKSDRVAIAGLYPIKILDSYISNVKGEATSNLGVSGTWESPQLTGSLKIENLNAFFPTLGRKVEDAKLHIDAADSGLNIVELYARENQGYLDAQGRIDLIKLAPSRIAMTMNLNEFGTSGFTPMPTYISASTWAELDMSDAEKDIRVGINDLIVNVPEQQTGSTFSTSLDGDILVLDPLKEDKGLGLEAITTTSKQAVLAKLQVDIAPGAQLKHPNAQIAFQGKLAIDIAGAQTAIFGDVQSTGGKLEVLGKQFRVDQGIVTFSGNQPPNPKLQVEASYIFDRSVAEELGPASSGDPRAVVRVYGTALRPQLRMSSDPQLTESQIIYVLVSDRAPETAQGGEEEGVASQAVAAASGLLAGMLKERAKSVYPIDMLRLQTTAGNISGVQVGKYFGKDLFFSYEFIFGAEKGENTNEFRLEYQFAPRWLMGGRFGDQANGALFLYWNVY